MPLLSEELGLQEAIKTTLLQLCKVGVNYQSELTLKGTIGLTVDKKEVILVHFNESVENGNTVVDSSQNVTCSTGSSSQAHRSITSCTRPSSIIKHTSLSEFGKMMMNTEPLKLSSASLWHSYLMSNNDNFMKEPSSSFTEQQFPGFAGRQIGKIEIPSTSTLNDRFSMDMTDRKDMLTLDAITIDLDSESDTFDPPLNFDDVEEDDSDKKVEQKQELTLLDDALASMPGIDVKTKVSSIDIELVAGTRNASNDAGDGETSGSPGKSMEQAGTSVSDSKLRSDSISNIPVFVTKSEILDAKQQWDAEDQWEDVDCDTNMEMLSETDSLHWARSKYYSCEVCGKQMPSIGKLEAHLVETHKLTESKEYGSIVFKQCPHCGKKFRFQATLDKHLFLHVAKRSYKCNLCSNNYCFPDSLEIHMGAHTGNYSCKKCKKSYSTKTLFQKHIVYMHEQRQHSTKK